MALLRRFGRIDYVVDCQNGIPFFSPPFVERDVPVVQVVHHVHQDQFGMRFGPVLAAVGRFLEGRGDPVVYKDRPSRRVSPSTRQELRRRLGFRGPIHIVPNGNSATPEVRSPRDPEPTITVVTRLVPHKRVDVLLAQLAITASVVPKLRVDIVGNGTERIRLTMLAAELGLDDIVTFHGYQPDKVRDELVRRAWLTMSTSHHEGWGLAIVEAAVYGVPTLALRVPGVRDSVVNGRTGWLVDEVGQFGAAAIMALRELADEDRAREITEACQAWARCFTWDRSANLLAGVLLAAGSPRSAPGTARPAATWASSPSSTGRATWQGRSPTRRCGRPTRWSARRAGRPAADRVRRDRRGRGAAADRHDRRRGAAGRPLRPARRPRPARPDGCPRPRARVRM